MSARVYGCNGRASTLAAGPCSTTWPRYMTTIWVAIDLTTRMSWETRT